MSRPPLCCSYVIEVNRSPGQGSSLIGIIIARPSRASQQISCRDAHLTSVTFTSRPLLGNRYCFSANCESVTRHQATYETLFLPDRPIKRLIALPPTHDTPKHYHSSYLPTASISGLPPQDIHHISDTQANPFRNTLRLRTLRQCLPTWTPSSPTAM